MGQTIFLNRKFIIFLLLMFITIYAFFYEKSYTLISSLYGELEDVFNSNFNEAELTKIYDFFQTINSMYFQIPVQFINTLFNLYVTSFILYIGLRLQRKYKKSSLEGLSYSNIVTIYYISLYAVMLNFAVQVFIMIATGNTVEILSNSFYLPYWGLFTLLQAGIVIYGVFKKYGVLLFPIVLYSLIMLVQLGFQWIL